MMLTVNKNVFILTGHIIVIYDPQFVFGLERLHVNIDMCEKAT